MADANDSQVRLVISQLNKVPGFGSLPDEKRNAMIQRAMQDKFGNIPNPENFLQNIINRTGEVGAISSSIGFPFPQMSRQLSRFPSAGFTEAGSDIATGDIDEPKFHLPEAKTPVGKTVSTIAPFVLPTVGLVKGGMAGAKGIGKLFGEKAARRELSDVALKGSESVSARMSEVFSEANKKFGESLSKLKSKMSAEDFADVLRSSAEDIGDVGSIGSSGNKLINFAEQISDLGKAGPESSKILSPDKVQFQIRGIWKLLGKDERAKAIFYNKVLDVLPESVPGLRELKASHAPIFKLAKKAKAFTRGSISRAGKGLMGPEELGRLQATEKELGGLNVLKEAIKSGKKIDRAKIAKRLATAGGFLGGASLGGRYLSGLLRDQ